jgi:hypothetical protein
MVSLARRYDSHMQDLKQTDVIAGGGINTGDIQQQGVVTEVLGIATDADPIREEELRARFLSFDPIVDADAELVAHELMLKGRLIPQARPSKALAQLDEDMLLTGLYSLVQDGLVGALPLFARIGGDLLLSDVPEQVRHPKLIWIVSVVDEASRVRVDTLRAAGMNVCLDLRAYNPALLANDDGWPYAQCHVDAASPTVLPAAQLIVSDVSYADSLASWPQTAWFKGSLYTGDATPPSPDFEIRLELLAIALRHPPETMMRFFKLNPGLEPRFLQLANSPVGGLSRRADTAAHALIMLGRQRMQRIAILTALAGIRTSANSRLFAKIALTRALFMGKIIRLGAPAENAAIGFRIGLLSTMPHAFALSTVALVRRLGLDSVTARALGGWATPENRLLKLAHACEENDTGLILHYSRELNLDMGDVSAAFLEAAVAGEALEPALI